MNTTNSNLEKIRGAVFRAVAIKGGPANYNDIFRECRGFPPGTLERYLRDKEIREQAGVVKTNNGEYTVTKLQKINGLGRFI